MLELSHMDSFEATYSNFSPSRIRFLWSKIDLPVICCCFFFFFAYLTSGQKGNTSWVPHQNDLLNLKEIYAVMLVPLHWDDVSVVQWREAD